MQQNLFEQIELARSEQGDAAALDRLVTLLREQKQWHNLFDARMLQKKFALGLPLARPASLQDVPEEVRKDVEATYMSAAREVGNAFLEEGDIGNAWMYFKVIHEPKPVAEALEKLPNEMDDYEKLDHMIQIALSQGVNPAKGVHMMLGGHGLCSTITALDQTLAQLTPTQRGECSKIMVRTLYDELRESVRSHVEQRIPMLPPDQSLQELIAGRDWLFEGGNYHVDVSHLSSIVRFARSIEAPAEELELALELAEYGSKLEKTLQFGGEPPFSDMYPAHVHFFNILLDRNREAGLKYFREQLESEPDERDKPLFAYVLVDLLIRSKQLDEAVQVAETYLKNLGEDVNVSFDELCVEAGRFDVLKKVRHEQENLVGYTAALVREPKEEKSTSS